METWGSREGERKGEVAAGVKALRNWLPSLLCVCVFPQIHVETRVCLSFYVCV